MKRFWIICTISLLSNQLQSSYCIQQAGIRFAVENHSADPGYSFFDIGNRSICAQDFIETGKVPMTIVIHNRGTVPVYVRPSVPFTLFSTQNEVAARVKYKVWVRSILFLATAASVAVVASAYCVRSHRSFFDDMIRNNAFEQAKRKKDALVQNQPVLDTIEEVSGWLSLTGLPGADIISKFLEKRVAVYDFCARTIPSLVQRGIEALSGKRIPFFDRNHMVGGRGLLWYSQEDTTLAAVRNYLSLIDWKKSRDLLVKHNPYMAMVASAGFFGIVMSPFYWWQLRTKNAKIADGLAARLFDEQKAVVIMPGTYLERLLILDACHISKYRISIFDQSSRIITEFSLPVH